MPRTIDPRFAVPPEPKPDPPKKKRTTKQAHAIEEASVRRYTLEETRKHRDAIAVLITTHALGLYSVKRQMLALAGAGEIPPITPRRIQTLYEKHVTESAKQFAAERPASHARCVAGVRSAIEIARKKGDLKYEIEARKLEAELLGLMQPNVQVQMMNLGITNKGEPAPGELSPNGLAAAPPDLLRALQERLLPEPLPPPPDNVRALTRPVVVEVVSPGKRDAVIDQ